MNGRVASGFAVSGYVLDATALGKNATDCAAYRCAFRAGTFRIFRMLITPRFANSTSNETFGGSTTPMVL